MWAPSTLSAASSPACAKATSASIDALAYLTIGTPAILAGVALVSFSLHATTAIVLWRRPAASAGAGR